MQSMLLCKPGRQHDHAIQLPRHDRRADVDGRGQHPITPCLVVCQNPYSREHIRRFGQYVLEMNDLSEPMEP
jgi:hypothetical protein